MGLPRLQIIALIADEPPTARPAFSSIDRPPRCGSGPEV
jgi:hypothetical protein